MVEKNQAKIETQAQMQERKNKNLFVEIKNGEKRRFIMKHVFL